MSTAWGRDEGIGVDVHVHRITNLWGWHETRTPEETRRELEAWLPRERWHEVNGLLVGFGQTWCPPVGRKCGECRLSEKGLCPSAVVKVSGAKVTKYKKVKSEKEEEGKVEDGNVHVKNENEQPSTPKTSEDVEIKQEIKLEIEPVNEVEAPWAQGETELNHDIKPVDEADAPSAYSKHEDMISTDIEDVGIPRKSNATSPR